MNELNKIVEEFKKERKCDTVLLIGTEEEINKIDLRNFPEGVEIQKVQEGMMEEHKGEIFLVDTSSLLKIPSIMFEPEQKSDSKNRWNDYKYAMLNNTFSSGYITRK